MGNISITKPNLIIVEGKTDEAIIKIILSNIEIYEEQEVQVIQIGGKDKLRILKNLILSSNKDVSSLLIIFDKDDNYDATKQKIENFLKGFSFLHHKDFIILPPKEVEGKELEDYICNIIKNKDKKLNILETCIKSISSEKKFGKKLFYTYLILNDSCKYEGISISSDIIKNCLKDYINEFEEITKKLEDFLEKIRR